MSRWVWIGGSAVALVGIVFLGRWLYGRAEVGYLFDLKDVPWSVSEVECETVFTSDTLLTCAFRIDATDFPRLLTNETFEQQKTSYARVHDYGMALGLGANFIPAYNYHAIPKDAEHGGSIDVFTNRTRTRVLAHLYIK